MSFDDTKKQKQKQKKQIYAVTPTDTCFGAMKMYCCKQHVLT
jgi:hypothetical protein